MNIASRLARYLGVWAQFHKVSALDVNRMSIDDLVREVMQFGGGFFAPIQIESEITEALREIHKLRPKYVVEVGTAGGGTLLLWSRVADPEATIVTIDLPGGDFGGGSSPLRVPLFRKLPLPTQTLHLIRGNSQIQETVELTRSYLKGNPADFLFIDADHTAKGVRTDYGLYSPLVRPGGIIAFHDIAIKRPEYGVQALWSELKEKHQNREILGTPLAYGIGLLYR
jgi:predicted O-methyltransferase YrrM